MNYARLARHLATSQRTIKKHFPETCLAEIKQAIIDSERTHRGQIQVAIEPALQPSQLWRNMSARERALELFASMHVWDTAENSGVLIYVLFADRSIEIVADRGVCARVAGDTWQGTADTMRIHFASGRYAQGILAGIAAVSGELRALLPACGGGLDELPNDVTLL
ncbi:TPM domain-containing protein [Pseudoduganella ginsengisoli]|uniref:TPM domain-containing protein n=1 Tax=Pseudoduganella ginsengisoli TaxID=1462440 RepID=UPI001478E667